MRRLDGQKQRSMKAHAEEPTSGRVPLSQDPLRWLYPVLIAGMLIVLLDRHLEPERIETRVLKAEQYAENVSSGHWSRPPSFANWVLVTLEDGTRFQTERTAYEFRKGTELVIEKSALFDLVVRYRMPAVDGDRWSLPEQQSDDYRPIPYLILVMCCLLLLPWWSLEYRYIGKGLLLIMVVSWTFILIGTGILKMFA